MTLTRLNEIPGLKVGDRVVCTSANGHDDGLPRPWWTVGKTYTVERVDEPYQPRVLDGEGDMAGASSGYFAPAPRETAEERPVTLTEGCFGVTRGGGIFPARIMTIVANSIGWHRWRALESPCYEYGDNGGLYSTGDQSENDIIATFSTRAAAEAHLRGEPEGKTLADGWLSIDTAPRDGTWFHARTEFGTERVVHFEDNADRFPISHDGSVWSTAPVQWMPLRGKRAPTPDPADQAELIVSLRQVIADMEDRGGEPVAADAGWDAEVKSLSFAGRTLQAWTLHDVAVNPEGAFAAINTIANRLATLAAAQADYTARILAALADGEPT